MVLEVVVISHVGLPLQYLCLGLTGHISPNKSIFFFKYLKLPTE